MMSDNKRNFVGTNAELYQAFVNATKNENFRNTLITKEIEWRFIPPVSLHFGGIWEEAVESVKSHMKPILGNMTPTWEKMFTLLCCTEACLNLRSYESLHDDVEFLLVMH